LCRIRSAFNISFISAIINSYTNEDKPEPTECEINIEIFYGGSSVYNSGFTSESIEGFFDKDSVADTTATIVITYVCQTLNISVNVACPQAEPMTIFEVVLTNNVDEGETIHAEYRYVDGAYIGPLQSNYVTFIDTPTAPNVSRYNVISGFAGSGAFPPEASIMTIRTNKIPPDSFVFEPGYNKFKYLRSSILYANNSVDISTMLSLAIEATPVTLGAAINSADFVVPNTSLGQYLYLIWDLRVSHPLLLCYSEMDVPDPRRDVCCDCTLCTSDCVLLQLYNPTDKGEQAEVYFPNGQTGCSGPSGPISVLVTSLETVQICVANDFEGDGMWQVLSGTIEITILECGCVACTEECSQWFYLNNGLTKATVQYEECGGCGELKEVDIIAGEFKAINICRDTTPTVLSGLESNLILTKYCGVCDSTNCVEFEVYDITGFTNISYAICGGGELNFDVNIGDTPSPFCVQNPYLPVVSDPTKAKIRIVGEGCNCETPPPL